MSIGIFLLFGLGILGGILSSTIMKKVRAPQVLGYLLAGIVAGKSGFGLITTEDIDAVSSFSVFALAVIGLMVGTEIRFSDFRRYGRQFMAILFGEGMGAFFLVSFLTGWVLYSVAGSFPLALAGGIVFGAISSATDPASTMSVLWEKKAAGILTKTITAVIALDDGLALLLYGLCSGGAQILAVHSGVTVWSEIGIVAVEIIGALLVGVAAGFLAVLFLDRTKDSDNSIVIPFGLFLLSIALSNLFGLDVVITALMFGMFVANRSPRNSKDFMHFIKSLSSPVYILFFLFTGARLSLGSMPGWLWLTVALFVVGRSAGKVAGAWVGAVISKAKPTVRKYMGLGLFSQGGVAIGLAVMAGHHLNNINITEGFTLGDAIITGVAATTFFIQLVGPATVSVAVRLAGENGMRISLEDLLETQHVSDVMSRELPESVLSESSTVGDAVEMFSATDANSLAVTDGEKNLKGVVTFESIRQILSESSFWQWSLAVDIMEFDSVTLSPETKLKDAIELSRRSGYFNLPVVEDGRLISVLNTRTVENSLKKELLEKQKAVSAA